MKRVSILFSVLLTLKLVVLVLHPPQVHQKEGGLWLNEVE